MGNSNHTFRFNKSLLNIQHIINQYEEPISINSTPKVRSTKTESLKSNNKDELMILFFKYKSVFVKAKQEQILLNPKWVGNYSFTINEENDDWRDMYKGTILIKRNSVIFHVEGYQIDQNYELLFNEDGNKLNLTYKKSLDNFVSDVLKNNNDFGIITFDGKEYKWKCPYLDISFADEEKNIYILKKESKKI
ncbi:DUF5991 domain-containing protein [Flavobacterium daemonense]|uniref:DUF5991 domain-containing protein n=1 Tax=Flavobacterium daemonense TaxID=1393049 RepID=UPI001185EEF6|nr:hypothetical protein [Flavobacterium daemonense]KAF2333762.1 hypothetical protein FND99_09845 [Flavobacterium daemonense]